VTFETLQNFELIIWDDLGQVRADYAIKMLHFPAGLQCADPALLYRRAFGRINQQLEHVCAGDVDRSDPSQPGHNPRRNGTVTIITDSNHQVINGRFGLVADFAYPPKWIKPRKQDSDQVLLGQSGNADVLLANQDSVTGMRTVTQNFLAVDGANDDESISERKRLFQNAVWWLLRKPTCDLLDLAVTQTAPNPAATGAELTYALTVLRTGECQATGVVVTDVLPAGVAFVSADTPLGTWSEVDGVVTFHLGLVADVSLPLTVTVTPMQPGQLTNSVSIRSNERDRNLNNNSSTLTIAAQGAAMPQQVLTAPLRLAVRMMMDGSVALSLTGQPGVGYTLETSSDLVNWKPWVTFLSAGVTTTLSDLPGTGVKFYRVVRQSVSQ